jgi:hypothetical protein
MDGYYRAYRFVLHFMLQFHVTIIFQCENVTDSHNLERFLVLKFIFATKLKKWCYLLLNCYAVLVRKGVDLGSPMIVFLEANFSQENGCFNNFSTKVTKFIFRGAQSQITTWHTCTEKLKQFKMPRNMMQGTTSKASTAC